MFIDGLIKALKAPFEFVRNKKLGAEMVRDGAKGDVARLKQVGGQYKNAAGKAGKVAQKAKAGGAAAQGGQKKAAKMGLFSKKKKCPSCGEKLHASWDQCPYCNWSDASSAPATGAVAAPPPAGAAPKNRTIAMDAPGGGGGGGGGGSGTGVGWLVPLDGPQSGEVLEIKGRAVVGTANDCDVVMREPSISGRHCEITSTRGGFRLTDLRSTNGSFVNDERVSSSTDLIDNDSVRLGRVNFKFKAMS